VGSTQFQHHIPIELPPKVLGEWLDLWRSTHQVSGEIRVALRPHTAGSNVLELLVTRDEARAANVVFEPISDRQGRSILSIRGQNTFEVTFRKKRLMSLCQIFLMSRYRADSIHYLTPTDDNHKQTEGMKRQGIFSTVSDEIGQIIVADIAKDRVRDLAASDHTALTALLTAR